MGQERQTEFTQLIEVQRNRYTIRLCAFTVPTHADLRSSEARIPVKGYG